MKEFVIVVAQHVVGKSKFPIKYGFKRYKPYPYKNSHELHRIVYARYFTGTEEKAREFAKEVEQAACITYVMGMGNTAITCVQDYTMLLHDITKDESIQLATTITSAESKNPAYLYDNATCSNKLLSQWKIVAGF